MYYLLGLNKDAIYFMAFSILYGCIVELCFNVWPNNVRLFSIIFGSLDWQSKFGWSNNASYQCTITNASWIK